MIVGYNDIFNALPLNNLTLRFDPSVSSTVWQTATPGNNPCWSSLASDGQAVQVMNSIVPASPSDLAAIYRSTTNQSPLYKTAAPALPLPDLLFDGSNDAEIVDNRTGTAAITISNFFGAQAATILVAFQIHACALNNGNAWINSPILGDTSSFMGLFVRRSSTGPDVHKLQFYNWDGNQDLVEFTITLNTNYVACWRHDTSNLYGSINGGSESSIASGATQSMVGALGFGGALASGTVFSNCSIGEILVYNVALTGAALAAANAYMTNKWN